MLTKVSGVNIYNCQITNDLKVWFVLQFYLFETESPNETQNVIFYLGRSGFN